MTLRRPTAVQNFTLTATSQLSSAFAAQTRRVWITHTSTDANLGGAFVLFGDSTGITASSSNGTLIPAPWGAEFDTTPGQRVAVVEATTGHGTLSVTELT
jgi:hypothetical protein